jgi:hypothetical protein
MRAISGVSQKTKARSYTGTEPGAATGLRLRSVRGYAQWDSDGIMEVYKLFLAGCALAVMANTVFAEFKDLDDSAFECEESPILSHVHGPLSHVTVLVRPSANKIGWHKDNENKLDDADITKADTSLVQISLKNKFGHQVPPYEKLIGLIWASGSIIVQNKDDKSPTGILMNLGSPDGSKVYDCIGADVDTIKRHHGNIFLNSNDFVNKMHAQ